jgi:hypothetical protein
MDYRCRMTIPYASAWIDAEAETPEQAAQDCHEHFYDLGDKGLGYRDERDGKITLVYFARIEVEGYGTYVSRMFYTGIFRKGGVKPRDPNTLVSIARALNYQSPPETLLDEGWTCEESWEEAQARKDEELR